jgi:aryl-alcohol dehydrogenase-like predicted oxidoreductase
VIEKLAFGRTGHQSTRVIFGGVALKRATRAEVDRALDLLLEYGINHIDTSPMYGDSEMLIKPWMARHRHDFFLATKTTERLYQKARDQIHRSLERLGVDHVELLQFHNLTDIVDWQNTLGPGGALEAVIEAREQGLTRFIGVSGHGLDAPRMHRWSMEHFDFDSVLLPYNYLLMQNREYATAFEKLVTLCQERNVAVQTMKSIGRRWWGDQPRQHVTWYQPLTEQAAIDTALHWAMDRPGIFLMTVGDVKLLPKFLQAASRFQAGPSVVEMEELVAQYEMKPLFV